MHRRRRWRQPWRARTPVVALLMAGLTACGSSRGAGLQGAGSQGAGPASRSARVVAVQTLGPRVRDLTIDSPALGRRAKVRLLLPRRFEDRKSTRLNSSHVEI